MIEKIAYQGWPNCYRMTNGVVELVITADVGPRIMRYGFTGGQNLFKEYGETLGQSGEEEWQLRGGHRIWSAPEHNPRTYVPDNGPVDIEDRDGVLVATQPVEASTGLEKQILVRMAPSGTAVEVRHRLRNTLPWAIDVAAWALTMMAQNGIAITGFPPRGGHPEVLPPTNPLVMWAFTDLTDPRWIFTKKYLLLKQDPQNREPQKLGHFNVDTWGAYWLGSELFLKRSRADAGKPYPDLGCSFETFTRHDMLELETLGPITKVEPGEYVEHTEHWSLHAGVHFNAFTDVEIDRILMPLLTPLG